MIIKRQYELINYLLLRDAASEAVFDRITKSVDPEVTSYVRRASFTLNETDMGCGLPGTVFNELLQAFDELDKTSPYNNGLTYQDVSKVVTYASRQGRAIRIVLYSQHFEGPERIVAVIAMNESKKIADWGIRKPTK